MRIEHEQFEDAEDRITRLTEIAKVHGFDGWTMVAATQQTALAGLLALHDRADPKDLARHAAALSAMTELWKRFDTRFFLSYYLMMTGVLYAGAGDERAAQMCLEESLRLGEETGMQLWRSEAIRHLALLDPQPDTRKERLRQALEVAQVQEATLFELRSALDLAELDQGYLAEVDRALGRIGPGAAYPEVARARAVLAAKG